MKTQDENWLYETDELDPGTERIDDFDSEQLSQALSRVFESGSLRKVFDSIVEDDSIDRRKRVG